MEGKIEIEIKPIVEKIENKLTDKEITTLKMLLNKINNEEEKRTYGKKYFYVGGQGDVYSGTEDFDRNDKARYEIGNYFKTEEEAEKQAKYLKIRAKIKRIADRLNKGYEIDWMSDYQNKYCLYYDDEDNTIEQDDTYYFKQQGTIYCLDENFSDECKKEIGEEELKDYLKNC